MEKTFPSRRSQSWETAPKRLESSPEEYLRKKFACRFITRIIMAASTAREVLVSIRFIIISRTVVMSWEEMSAQSMNTAVPMSRTELRLCSTKPVSARLRFVISMPKNTVVSVSAPSATMSPPLRQFLR